MVLTTPAAWINHYMGWDYTGASIGQSNPYNENTGSIQIASSEKLQEKSGFTINIHSQRYDTGTATSAMGGAEISWRYHLDYSMDLFDEDNEEILFTKDADLDGSTAYFHIYASTNVNIDNLLHAWSFEPFACYMVL